MVQTCRKLWQFADHRDFTVAVHLKGGRCPCCVGRAGSNFACRGGDSRDPTVAGRRDYRAVCRVPHFMAVAVVKGFFARFTGLFRTPSTWDVECPSARLAATFLELPMANSCWSSRAPVL